MVVEIAPLPRGSGFVFSDTITGGVVPKQYIPAVEQGIREWMGHGPLGFPVVDFSVNLSDGSYHDVDSSEMAFKTAARIAMVEGMPQCSPVLLEPIVAVEIHCPSDATSRVNQIVTGHRGQLLGYDGRDGWPGWDTVKAHMPESEMASLIIELRSATAGVGTFTYALDHMAELTGTPGGPGGGEQAGGGGLGEHSKASSDHGTHAPSPCPAPSRRAAARRRGC